MAISTNRYQMALRSCLRLAAAPRAALNRTFSVCPPHGGVLVDLMVDPSEMASLVSTKTQTFELNDRQSCDVELIVNGAFSPIEGPMNKATYDNVVDNMRLPENNLLFGLPVVFDTDCTEIGPGASVLLKYGGKDIAVLDVEDKFEPNK